MKYLLLVAVAGIFGMGGCASNSQVFVGPQGQTYRCASYGAGLAGVINAQQIFDDCLKSYRLLGYLEIERVGVIGLSLVDDVVTKEVKVIKVIDRSPAAGHGIKPGDVISGVGGNRITNMAEAAFLLAGEKETAVDVELVRGGVPLKATLIRAPYISIYGTSGS